jgi:hypothetical protein
MRSETEISQTLEELVLLLKAKKALHIITIILLVFYTLENSPER